MRKGSLGESHNGIGLQHRRLAKEAGYHILICIRVFMKHTNIKLSSFPEFQSLQIAAAMRSPTPSPYLSSSYHLPPSPFFPSPLPPLPPFPSPPFFLPFPPASISKCPAFSARFRSVRAVRPDVYF